MSVAITNHPSFASIYNQPSDPARQEAVSIANELLQPGSAFSELERQGYGLRFDTPDFSKLLAAAVDAALVDYKASNRNEISDELPIGDRKNFIKAFVNRAKASLNSTPGLGDNPILWLQHAAGRASNKEALYSIIEKAEVSITNAMTMNRHTGKPEIPKFVKPKDLFVSNPDYNTAEIAEVSNLHWYASYEELSTLDALDVKSYVDKARKKLHDDTDLAVELKQLSGDYADSISETDGQNIWSIYESKLTKVSQEREILYKELKKSIAVQEELNNIRGKISAALKSKPDLKSDKNLDAGLTSSEWEFLKQHGVGYPSNWKQKGGLEVISENISNKVKQLSDDSQLLTTDLQDAISRHNNLSEAISKLIQKMYETSKSFTQ